MLLIILGASLMVLIGTYLILAKVQFKNRSYLAAAIIEPVNEKKADWRDSMTFITGTIGKGYLTKQRENILKEISDANVVKTPEQVVVEQFFFSITTFLLCLMFYLILGSQLYLVAGIIGGVAMFFDPRTKLRKKIKGRREQIRKETPNFALTVRLLLKGQKSAVDALRLACAYGVGSELKSYADMLVHDLEYMKPEEALHKFAVSTGVNEMAEFAAAMRQFIIVGAGKDGEEILFQMEQTFRELDKKMMETEKITRPAKLKLMNILILLNGVAFILSALVLFFMKLLSGGFGA